ncbi:MAG TPA: helical backbone metal receptor [bacterium]
MSGRAPRRAGLTGLTGLAAALALLAAGCAGAGPWRDGMGRAVPLPLPARTVASLAPNVTEILYAIGAEDRLVGVSAQCDYPLAAKLKPKIGNFNRPDLAQARALHPDIVLFAEYARAEDLAALEKEGIAAAVLSFRDLADLSRTMRLVGRITGRVQQAEDAAASLERTVVDVTKKLAGVAPGQRPSVYIEVEGPSPIYAVGSGSFMGDIIRVAGGRNVFEEGPGPYNRLSQGDVARANPDVMLIDHPFQYKVGVSKRPGWSELTAVKNHKVYDGSDFDLVLLNRASPRVAQSLWEIARLLHPEVFAKP